MLETHIRVTSDVKRFDYDDDHDVVVVVDDVDDDVDDVDDDDDNASYSL